MWNDAIVAALNEHIFFSISVRQYYVKFYKHCKILKKKLLEIKVYICQNLHNTTQYIIIYNIPSALLMIAF